MLEFPCNATMDTLAVLAVADGGIIDGTTNKTWAYRVTDGFTECTEINLEHVDELVLRGWLVIEDIEGDADKSRLTVIGKGRYALDVWGKKRARTAKAEQRSESAKAFRDMGMPVFERIRSLKKARGER